MKRGSTFPTGAIPLDLKPDIGAIRGPEVASSLSPTIKDCIKDLVIPDELYKKCMENFLCCICEGLQKKTHEKATIKCFATYVQDLPDGTEKGKFLALDLGGTNFRVLLIQLDHNKFDMQSKTYEIPQPIMTGTGEQLFDHIASCLADFAGEQKIKDEHLPLGFTFSFPLLQVGLTKGILQTWTKGFSCTGVVGQDVVQFLKDAIARRGDIKIDIFAILNDTTGTLMSCAWKDHNCKVGVIVGTGCNACYVEQTKNCEVFDGDRCKPELIINTEWGAFGNNKEMEFIITEYDREVDKASINPGKQLFEKMISGMYLGELVRLVIVKMINTKCMFGGKGSDCIFKTGNFETKFVSEIEADKPGVYTRCKNVLDDLCLNHATEQDFVNLRYICECVTKRAAYLVSAGIAVLINKMPYKEVTVGVDGSVYRFHPHFHNLMMEKLKCLVKPDIKFNVMLSEDGSGRGAALVAAVASKNATK